MQEIYYNTIVYKNPNSSESNSIDNPQNTLKSSLFGLVNSLTVVYSVYDVIMGLSVALIVFVMLIETW
jgi:hypothetical protein